VPPPIPFISDLITEQTIVVVANNVSTNFKDANGIPSKALDIDINKFKPQIEKAPCQDCSEVKSTDGVWLPTSPPWPWSDDGEMEPSENAKGSSPVQKTQFQGTNHEWYYWEYEPTTEISSIGVTSIAAGELKKYVDLFNKDIPIWNAYIKMGDDGRALYQAIQITNEVFEINSKNSGGWFSGLQNKSDFTNFILDGTLPSILNVENGRIVGNYKENLIRRLNVEFYGIIYLKKLDLLSNETLNTYKDDIQAFEKISPGKNNYRDAYEKNN
jgi:hypothetical protein